MSITRRGFTSLSGILAAALLFSSLYIPAANAAMVSTDALLREAQMRNERARIEALLDRADLRAALLNYGVDANQIQDRLGALTDDEVRALAQDIESLPAGGTDPLGFLLIIFIVLLVTDILGFTQVFPFVKHRAR